VRGRSVLGLGASQEANRTGRKGLPRFAPLLYIRQEIYCISRFIYVTFITYSISAVQSHLQLHFSKYFLLGTIYTGAAKFSNGGCRLSALPHSEVESWARGAVMSSRVIGGKGRACSTIGGARPLTSGQT